MTENYRQVTEWSFFKSITLQTPICKVDHQYLKLWQDVCRCYWPTLVGAKVMTKWHYKYKLPGDGDDVCLFIDNELYHDDIAHKWMWNSAPAFFLDNKNEYHGVCPNLVSKI